MLDVKDACSILGVKEGASKDEMVRRYDILLKKQRMNKLEGIQDNEGVSIDDINKAYNLLMGYETEKPEPEINRKPNPILKKAGIDEKKFNNFLYYYKLHIIIGIVVLIALFSIIKGCVTRVDPDLNIVFMGEYYMNEGFKEVLGNEIRSKVPSVKEPGIDVIPISDKFKGQEAYAYQMKAMTVMAAGDVDICIADKANFEKYAKAGGFINLDSIAGELKADREKNKDNILKTEGSTEEHLYGISITGSSLLKNDEIKGKEFIVALRTGAKHYNSAVEVMKLLMK